LQLQVLSGEHDKVTTIWPHTIRTLLGVNGIANSLGSAHYYKRKIASKAFSRAALNSYIPSILDKCRRNVGFFHMLCNEVNLQLFPVANSKSARA